MKIFCTFPTVNIYKLNFWLAICIAKNFICKALNVIFSIFRFCLFFATSDSRFTNSFISAKYCPILTSHTLMESLFIQLWYDQPLWLILWSRFTLMYFSAILKSTYLQILLWIFFSLYWCQFSLFCENEQKVWLIIWFMFLLITQEI